MKLTFPLNSLIYDDNFRDPDNVYYLAQYDSYAYISGSDNPMSYLARFLQSVFHTNIGVYYFPAVISVICVVLFYFVARRIMERKIAFYTSLIFTANLK
jgi:dolichyl-phosphate-mannose--protein O-mannosyl transferase